MEILGRNAKETREIQKVPAKQSGERTSRDGSVCRTSDRHHIPLSFIHPSSSHPTLSLSSFSHCFSRCIKQYSSNTAQSSRIQRAGIMRRHRIRPGVQGSRYQGPVVSSFSRYSHSPLIQNITFTTVSSILHSAANWLCFIG